MKRAATNLRSAFQSNILTLPLFPAMRDSDVPRVVAALLQVLNGARA